MGFGVWGLGFGVQILWSLPCLEALLQLAPSSGQLRERLREWLAYALLLSPATTQGLVQVGGGEDQPMCACIEGSTDRGRECVQEVLRKGSVAKTTALVALLATSRVGGDGEGSPPGWPPATPVSQVPAGTAAAAAAAGRDPEGVGGILGTSIASANVKAKYAGEVEGTLQARDGDVDGGGGKWSALADKLVGRLQALTSAAQQGTAVSEEEFREASLRAAALLLHEGGHTHHLLLQVLCWAPPKMGTCSAMVTGVYVWTWLLAARPGLRVPLIAEMADAWMWTVEERGGLFGGEGGPRAQLRPHLESGEPEDAPAVDPGEGIAAHGVWLGFLLDQYEVRGVGPAAVEARWHEWV